MRRRTTMHTKRSATEIASGTPSADLKPDAAYR
jgi:hypothetical protein